MSSFCCIFNWSEWGPDICWWAFVGIVTNTPLKNAKGPQEGSTIGLKTIVLGGLTVALFWFLCTVVAAQCSPSTDLAFPQPFTLGICYSRDRWKACYRPITALPGPATWAQSPRMRNFLQIFSSHPPLHQHYPQTNLDLWGIRGSSQNRWSPRLSNTQHYAQKSTGAPTL